MPRKKKVVVRKQVGFLVSNGYPSGSFICSVIENYNKINVNWNCLDTEGPDGYYNLGSDFSTKPFSLLSKKEYGSLWMVETYKQVIKVSDETLFFWDKRDKAMRSAIGYAYSEKKVSKVYDSKGVLHDAEWAIFDNRSAT